LSPVVPPVVPPTADVDTADVDTADVDTADDDTVDVDTSDDDTVDVDTADLDTADDEPAVDGAAAPLPPPPPPLSPALPPPVLPSLVTEPAAEPADATAGPLAPEPSEVDHGPWARRPIGLVLVSVVVVLAIAASVLLAVVAQRVAHHNGANAARKDAIAAARTETAATLTYDYRHLDADFAVAERGLTPKFRASYAQTTAMSVVPLARKTHAISTATIAASGVISAGSHSAQVLVYADQTVQNNLLKATSRLDRSVIEVTMVKTGGRWLISNLEPF
jgi:Mce-associated membrane protein